ncbi:hypothetical protein B0H14DRAFT_3713757 [Mycena olivaceomarginata]|nr:hypothetical protein B0H14DRAFT_3713757 [Mycena olivaceomarginata]
MLSAGQPIWTSCRLLFRLSAPIHLIQFWSFTLSAQEAASSSFGQISSQPWPRRALVRFCLYACVSHVPASGAQPPKSTRVSLLCPRNIAYPCLMFSKIVPSFSVCNISALGPIVLVAVIYQVLGGLVA